MHLEALTLLKICAWSLFACASVCAHTYSYNVNKVVFSQRVQDRINGVLGYCQPESLHAATDIHDDYHIFRRCGCLDVPKET